MPHSPGVDLPLGEENIVTDQHKASGRCEQCAAHLVEVVVGQEQSGQSNPKRGDGNLSLRGCNTNDVQQGREEPWKVPTVCIDKWMRGSARPEGLIGEAEALSQ